MISVGEGDSIDKETRYRSVLVKMSDGNIHAGKVNIHGFPRLSDFIKDKNDEFIVLVPYDGDPHANVTCPPITGPGDTLYSGPNIM
jgi:hypothetical protein